LVRTYSHISVCFLDLLDFIMDNCPSQVAFSTQLASSIQNSQSLLNGLPPNSELSPIPSTPRPRSKILDALQERPWGHIFKTPAPIFESQPTQTTQPSESRDPVDRTVDSSAFAVCQTQILRSTEDLRNLVQDLTSSITQDKAYFETLITDAKALLEAGRHEEHRRETIVEDQLTSIRQIVDTISDSTSGINVEVVKLDGTVEHFEETMTKLEVRLSSMEKELTVSASA